MTRRSSRRGSLRDKVAAALLLFAYLGCLLLLDPAWVTWVGSMAVGVLSMTDLPPAALSFAQTPLSACAGVLSGLASLLALGLVAGVGGDDRAGGQ